MERGANGRQKMAGHGIARKKKATGKVRPLKIYFIYLEGLFVVRKL